MALLNPRPVRSALFIGAALALGAAASEIRVVPCDQPVKSMKRGICLNHMDREDYLALAPGVSWWYNWHFNAREDVPAEAGMEFLPMVWGDNPQALDGLAAYLTNHTPRRILVLNEPNMKGQAFIPPEQAALLYAKVKAIADGYQIPVVGPHMALGSASNASITAMDPIANQQVTYTFMVPYLKAFLHFSGKTWMDAVAAHTYGNLGEVKWMVDLLHKEFNRPVWITEFAHWNAKSLEEERDFLIRAVDFFERTPHVEGYAWFKDRIGKNRKISLLDSDPGTLTALGETYVNMPVHDPRVFYRLPGRLQAERYVRMQGAEIAATTDGDGFLDMEIGPKNWIEYNVAVERHRTFALKIRFESNRPAEIEIMSGRLPLATVQSTTSGWQTAEATIALPAANQSIRVRSSTPVRVNWMEFGATE